MNLKCSVNGEQALLLGFVAVGPNNQPHAVVSIQGVIQTYPVGEVTLEDEGQTKKVRK